MSLPAEFALHGYASCSCVTPIDELSVLPFFQPSLIFLCAAASLRESTSFIWGYACVSKYADYLGVQNSIFFINL